MIGGKTIDSENLENEYSTCDTPWWSIEDLLFALERAEWVLQVIDDARRSIED